MKRVSRHPLLLGTASLVLAGATLYGCKDFLSSAAAPQGTLNEETLANPQGVEATLIAAYRTLDCTTSTNQNWGCAASNWVWGSVPSDDAHKGSEASDQPPVDDIELYQWATDNALSYLNIKWRAVYEGVVRSNATLRVLKKVLAERPGELSAANARGIEGEATFLRAHYHFEAWRTWGNVPYYKEDDTDFRKPNAPNAATGSAEVVTNILADLDRAIELLPTTPRNNQRGRVTQWTAKAYRGRVQMYAGQFPAALATLRDVRASGPYRLQESFDRVWSGFAEYENGPNATEAILAYQASANDGEPNGDNANWGERLNFPHGTSPFTCCGFHQPSQNLVNFFQVDDAGLPLALSSPSTWNTRSTNLTASASATLAVDPRLDWTVGRDGVPYKDWGPHQPAWIRQAAWGGPYSPKKNAHEKASGSQQLSGGWAPTQQNSVNMHIFRYADMLLLLAEAEVEAGSLESARLIVNEIRRRAGARAQGPGADRSTMAVPINDASITWAVYRVGEYPAAGWTQDFARTAVRYERRLELAMEGQRFFDLKRWGIAHDVLNAYIHDGIGGGAEKDRRTQLANAVRWAGATDRKYLFPIPPIQIELSKVGAESRLTQNPSW